ncbi:MAG: hypothetical protein IT380_21130 [Myxococcales bacterium]|nr:hypothetical protein [Myxococcales bacterium]
MLRPALLLLSRTFRPGRLLTLGFTSRLLGHWCQSATRLSGDYRDGTFTRWNGAAWLGFGGRFRSNHAGTFECCENSLIDFAANDWETVPSVFACTG